MVQQPLHCPSGTLGEISTAAVTAALAGNWQEATDLNYQAIELTSDDSGSFNRLATALIELG
jgi:hypothetical protein